MQAETALPTEKGGLRLAIGTLPVSAARTRGARVGRVYQPDFDTRPGRLVGKEHPQLEEGPGMPFVAVFAPNHCLLSNAAQVFESQCLARYDGFVDQGLTDFVVDIFHVAAFSPAYLLEATFGRFGSHPLQSGATSNKATALPAHLRPRKLLARTICCHIADAQVYPKSVLSRGHIGGVFALSDMQEIGSSAPDQFRATDLPIGVNQHLMLAQARKQTHYDAPIDGVERDAVEGKQAVRPRIVAETGAWPKLRPTGGFGRRHGFLALVFSSCMRFAPPSQLLGFLRSHSFDGFHRLCTGADRQLRTQLETGAGLPVDAVMGGIGIGDAFLPTHGRNPGRGLVETVLRLLQCRLMTRDIQFHADGSGERFIHKKMVVHLFKEVKRGAGQGDGAPAGAWQFLPRMNAGGLLATSL